MIPLSVANIIEFESSIILIDFIFCLDFEYLFSELSSSQWNIPRELCKFSISNILTVPSLHPVKNYLLSFIDSRQETVS
jgi:hypothetical protein